MLEIFLVLSLLCGVLLLIVAIIKSRTSEESWFNAYSRTLWKDEITEDFIVYNKAIRTVNSLISVGMVALLIFMLPTWANYTSMVNIPNVIAILVPYILIFFTVLFVVAAIKNLPVFYKDSLVLVGIVIFAIFILDIWLPYPVINPDGEVNTAVIGYKMSPDYVVAGFIGEMHPLIKFLFIYTLFPAILVAIVYLIYIRWSSTSKTLEVVSQWRKKT